MDNIQWTNKYVAREKLKGFEMNPREITEHNDKLLAGSLEEYGQAKPLLVNNDLTVIAGNQRLRHLPEQVWIRQPNRNLSVDECKEICILHNNDIGDWDTDKLESLEFGDLALVDEFGFDEEFVGGLGFDFDDLDFDDMDASVVIKKMIVKFPEGEDVQKLTQHAVTLLNVSSFEEALLELITRYNEND